MSWESYLEEDRRLVILRALETQNGYSLNESVLHTTVERFGHNVSRDRVRGDLAWLRDQGLVELELVVDSVYVAKLTQRGQDVAKGRTVYPGVKRPSAG